MYIQTYIQGRRNIREHECWSPPYFGSLVNPFSIWVERLCPPSKFVPTKIFDIPAALCTGEDARKLPQSSARFVSFLFCFSISFWAIPPHQSCCNCMLQYKQCHLHGQRNWLSYMRMSKNLFLRSNGILFPKLFWPTAQWPKWLLKRLFLALGASSQSWILNNLSN